EGEDCRLLREGASDPGTLTFSAGKRVERPIRKATNIAADHGGLDGRMISGASGLERAQVWVTTHAYQLPDSQGEGNLFVLRHHADRAGEVPARPPGDGPLAEEGLPRVRFQHAEQ